MTSRRPSNNSPAGRRTSSRSAEGYSVPGHSRRSTRSSRTSASGRTGSRYGGSSPRGSASYSRSRQSVGRRGNPYDSFGSDRNARGGRDSEYTSVRIGDMRRNDRKQRAQHAYGRYVVRLGIVLAIVVALVIGWAAVYNSNLFTITNVSVNGVEHLTSEDMSTMMGIPEGTTLLRVDTGDLRTRLMKNAWVQDVTITRQFPDTLQVDVTERVIAAVVEVPSSNGKSKKSWAMSSDHIWLMPIPTKGTEAAGSTSQAIYDDAEEALHITDVPYGTEASIGAECTDSNVNNALDIVFGLTTELSDQVVEVSAAGPEETTLLLDNGVEIAFGKAEDIRDKERVILAVLEENEGRVSYINVRVVDNPTWRTV